MYTLYYTPGSCSMAVHAVLEELGASYKPHFLDRAAGELQSEEFLKINPRGQVAAIMTDEGPITENAAIIIYLNDKHDGALLGKSEYERAIALQWLAFVNSTLHPAYARFFMVAQNDGDEKMIKAVCDGVQKQWDEIERHLSETGNEYLAGDQVGAADIYAAVVANWSFIPHMPKFGEKTKAMLKKVSERPAFQAAVSAHEIEYKAAA